MIAQIGAHLGLHPGRVLAGVDRGRLEVDADRFGEAAAAFERSRVGRVVVHAQERLDARRLRLLARRLAGGVFRLSDVHDRAELRALLLGAGVDRDERNVLRGDLGDRALQHVEVGDRDDHAVVVARGGLFDQTRHVGDIAVRRIAVVGLDVEILVRLFDGVLDGVPPRVRIRRVADQHEVGVGRGERRADIAAVRQRQCRHQNPERSLALAKSHCLHLSRSVVIEGSVWQRFRPHWPRMPLLTTKIRPSSGTCNENFMSNKNGKYFHL